MTLVEVGGDIIAQGDDPELLSPLADSMTLAALDDLPRTGSAERLPRPDGTS